MTGEALRERIQRAEYDFLRTDPHLGERIVLLTLGGSHAYGTEVEGSDVDIRGCALNSRAELLGFHQFEQVIDEKTDTTVYSFQKLVRLLLSCNPNTIELLGGRPEHYIVLREPGRKLLENRKLFLSQRAAISFGAYAEQQLRRLENALARDSELPSQREAYILHACEAAMSHFHTRYWALPEGALRLYLDQSERGKRECEIFMDVSLKHYPLRDYQNIWGDLNKLVKNFGALNHRSHKKDDAHLAKHMMHLVRLYLMCFDILERGEIVTYRAAERGELLAIRQGKYLREGQILPEFNDLLETYSVRMEYAKAHTILPEQPDLNQIEQLVMDINAAGLQKEAL